MELHQDGWRAGGPLVALHSMDHLGIHLLRAFHQNPANKHMTKTDIKTKTIKTMTDLKTMTDVKTIFFVVFMLAELEHVL